MRALLTLGTYPPGSKSLGKMSDFSVRNRYPFYFRFPTWSVTSGHIVSHGQNVEYVGPHLHPTWSRPGVMMSCDVFTTNTAQLPSSCCFFAPPRGHEAQRPLGESGSANGEAQAQVGALQLARWIWEGRGLEDKVEGLADAADAMFKYVQVDVE